MKLIVDVATDKVLGAAIVGPDAAETIQVCLHLIFMSFYRCILIWKTSEDYVMCTFEHVTSKPVIVPYLSFCSLPMQAVAIAVKCGATKAQFDSTVINPHCSH